MMGEIDNRSQNEDWSWIKRVIRDYIEVSIEIGIGLEVIISKKWRG